MGWGDTSTAPFGAQAYISAGGHTPTKCPCGFPQGLCTFIVFETNVYASDEKRFSEIAPRLSQPSFDLGVLDTNSQKIIRVVVSLLASAHATGFRHGRA